MGRFRCNCTNFIRFDNDIQSRDMKYEGTIEYSGPRFGRRGRDAGCPAPPAQIPASGITAQGSYLMTRKRCSG